MALRLIEMVLPAEEGAAFRKWLEEESVAKLWQAESLESGFQLKALLPAEQTEGFLDELEKRFGGVEGFRVVILPVEAAIPRMEEQPESPAPARPGAPQKKPHLRVSREELFNEVADSMKLTQTYVALVVLSSIVAAIGLMRDNLAVIIGAMVIAPLLGPNVGLALATALGDFKMGRQALGTNLTGVGMAFVLAAAAGLVLAVDPGSAEISSRTEISLADVVLALASGSAGVLAFTSGVPTAVIGVMVAVALLPPVVTLGLLLGSGYFSLAAGALLLLLTNIICVNLAGVTTFLVQGVQPRAWWEAHQAKRAARKAIIVWTLLLAALVLAIYLSEHR